MSQFTARRVRRSLAGFTLIEVLVIAVLVAVLAAFAIPTYQSYISTARKDRIMKTVLSFSIFEQNYRVDNQTYFAGSYTPGGANSFAGPLGYQVQNDTGGVSFTVSAGACGSIASCYKVVAIDKNSTQGTWDSSTNAWTWSP